MRGWVRVQVASRPLFSRPTSGTFANFQLYGESRPTTPILSNPASFTEAVAQVVSAVNSVRFRPYGRYYDDQSGEWRNVSTLPQPGNELLVQDRSRRLTTADSNLFGALFTEIAGEIDTGYEPIMVCAQWPAEFVDEGRGESRGLPYPASNAEAVLAEADHWPLWAGTLDAAGCTPPLTLKNFTGYAFVLRTKFHRDFFGSGSHITVLDKFGEPETTAAGFSTQSVLRPASLSGPIYLNLSMDSPGNDETRVSAAISGALYAHGARMPPGAYTVRANERCSNLATACFRPDVDTLFIGANNDSPPTHNSQYKFVIAHELGHAVQFKGSGLMRADYANSPSKNDPGACGCQFVSDPNDRSHCMQSKETLGIATGEGFAHYFAASTWNYDDPSNCTFVYYKNFKEGSVLLKPPLARTCAAPVQWLETNCLQAQRGVEWDWMNFQRAITVSSAPTRLGDLLDIYKEACGGTTCTGVERGFLQLDVAAKAKYGTFDPRAVAFTNEGVSFGVDH